MVKKKIILQSNRQYYIMQYYFIDSSICSFSKNSRIHSLSFESSSMDSVDSLVGDCNLLEHGCIQKFINIHAYIYILYVCVYVNGIMETKKLLQNTQDYFSVGKNKVRRCFLSSKHFTNDRSAS